MEPFVSISVFWEQEIKKVLIKNKTRIVEKLLFIVTFAVIQKDHVLKKNANKHAKSFNMRE